MFKLLLTIALLASSSLALNVPFDSCPGQPSFTSITIPDCPRDPCSLAVGDEFTLVIGINVTATVSSLPVRVFLIPAGGIPIEFPVPTGDACNTIAGRCPLAAGVHFLHFPAETSLVSPGVTTILVEVDDQDGNPVACGSVTSEFV